MKFNFEYVSVDVLIEVVKFVDSKDNVGKQSDEAVPYDTTPPFVKVSNFEDDIQVLEEENAKEQTRFAFTVVVSEENAKNGKQLAKVYDKLKNVKEKSEE